MIRTILFAAILTTGIGCAHIQPVGPMAKMFPPKDKKIDTENMDRWVFPVGTKVWKQFSLDGVKLETRLLEKREDGWFRCSVGAVSLQAIEDGMARLEALLSRA